MKTRTFQMSNVLRNALIFFLEICSLFSRFQIFPTQFLVQKSRKEGPKRKKSKKIFEWRKKISQLINFQQRFWSQDWNQRKKFSRRKSLEVCLGWMLTYFWVMVQVHLTKFFHFQTWEMLEERPQLKGENLRRMTTNKSIIDKLLDICSKFERITFFGLN